MNSGLSGSLFLGSAVLILIGVVGLISGFILRKRWLAVLGFLVLLGGIALLLMLDVGVWMGVGHEY